jgi:hypothetical protein
LTFLRQVLALVECPALLKPENREWALQKFAPDAIERAEQVILNMPSTGAYTHSQGSFPARYLHFSLSLSFFFWNEFASCIGDESSRGNCL